MNSLKTLWAIWAKVLAKHLFRVTEATQKITGLVNKFSDFNDKTGGGASKVLAYSAGITGLVAGVSFIIPKLETAATI